MLLEYTTQFAHRITNITVSVGTSSIKSSSSTRCKDRTKIECHVYKDERNENNDIIKTTFLTRKKYTVGEKNTVMYKDGKEINQVNVSRIKKHDAHHPLANTWINKMHDLDFTLDTYSEYNDTISLYFD